MLMSLHHAAADAHEATARLHRMAAQLIADRELLASADAADRAARLSARADRASVMSAARSALTALAARSPTPPAPGSRGPDPLHSPPPS
jgi:hypothetical protein